MFRNAIALLVVGSACGVPLESRLESRHRSADFAPHSRAAESSMLQIVAGRFVLGSTPEEREQAYDSHLETSGGDGARKRKWFQFEAEQKTEHLPAYVLDAYPVTQAAFSEFILDVSRPPPFVSASTWKAQGFNQDYQREVQRYNWLSSSPPRGREDHPVVLVPWHEAQAYCRWRGNVVGASRRLPTADEFEKAARGPSGAPYPWGNVFEKERLNSAIGGPRDTVSVRLHKNGMSAAGAFDMAGNVFQWTSTPWTHGKNRMTVKGSAWDDAGGLGRAAAAHGRPQKVRHAIVGFRCAGNPG